jgi:hypothetical protein
MITEKGDLGVALLLCEPTVGSDAAATDSSLWGTDVPGLWRRPLADQGEEKCSRLHFAAFCFLVAAVYGASLLVQPA